MNRYWGLQHVVRGKRDLRSSVIALLACACSSGLQAAALAQNVPPGAQQVTVDALSVVKVHTKAVPDARSRPRSARSAKAPASSSIRAGW